MKDIHLIQISLEELEELISRAVWKELKNMSSNNTKSSATLLSRQQAADLLGISLPTLHTYTKKGLIISYKIPGSDRVLFKQADLVGSLQQVKVSRYNRI